MRQLGFGFAVCSLEVRGRKVGFSMPILLFLWVFQHQTVFKLHFEVFKSKKDQKTAPNSVNHPISSTKSTIIAAKTLFNTKISFTIIKKAVSNSSCELVGTRFQWKTQSNQLYPVFFRVRNQLALSKSLLQGWKYFIKKAQQFEIQIDQLEEFTFPSHLTQMDLFWVSEIHYQMHLAFSLIY